MADGGEFRKSNQMARAEYLKNHNKMGTLGKIPPKEDRLTALRAIDLKAPILNRNRSELQKSG